MSCFVEVKEAALLGILDILSDERTIEKFTIAVEKVVLSNRIRSAALEQIRSLMADPQVLGMTVSLVEAVSYDSTTQERARLLATDAVQTVLNDPHIQKQTSAFLRKLLKDQELQRSGGDAVYGILLHSVGLEKFVDQKSNNALNDAK